MADLKKYFSKNDTVAANTTNNSNRSDYATAIPLGDIWILKKFYYSDINMGNNKSSVYILMFGLDIKRVYSATGNSKAEDANIELVGDGVKKVGIIRRNYDSITKELPFEAEVMKKE